MSFNSPFLHSWEETIFVNIECSFFLSDHESLESTLWIDIAT